MPTTQRIATEGTRRGLRAIAQLGDEFRERRLELGLSQAAVGASAGISGSHYSRVENGRLARLGIVRATLIGRVLGLDVVVRAYPGPTPLRDDAHGRHLDALLHHAALPLVARREVPLPQRADAPTEQRAWDALVTGAGLRTAFEMEMRLRDVQALERRLQLKLRDDPVDRFVLALADTRTNRAALRARPLLDLPRLTPGLIISALRAGQHPPSGVVLVAARRGRRPPGQLPPAHDPT